MPNADQKREAYAAGAAAHKAGYGPTNNPYAPIPPGDILLARLWRAGWHAAQRKETRG
jgi:hypothetical protein